MTQLARIADPEELSRRTGSIGRTKIAIPTSWLGSLIEVDVPARLACGACDGGGCDRCGRSGAFKRETGAFKVTIELPPHMRDGVLLRLPGPFEGGGPDVLLMEIRAGEEADASCRLVRRARPDAATLILVAMTVAAVVWVLWRALS